MKKSLLFNVILILCMLCVSAGAAPAVTDGATTGWIADNNYLYFQKEDGRNLQMPMEMDDLLTMTENELICIARDQRIIAVKKDGSGSRVVDKSEAETIKSEQTKSSNAILLPDNAEISASPIAAATDGIYNYEVVKDNQSFILRVNPLSAEEKQIFPGSRDAYATSFANRAVTEPLNLTVTREALTLTGTDHQVTVMSLINGEVTNYPATSQQTAAASLMNGVLYRYTLSEDQHWVLESGTILTTPTPAPTATLAPTTAPATTAVPTVTPKPTATPKSGNQTEDNDGTIYYGARGNTVKKIQQRLHDLGYPVGSVDGKYGSETQLAINLFCDAIHVREHNYITQKVYKKLMSKDAPEYDEYLPLKKGDRGVSVLRMQTRLKELGYDPGKLDGIYGKQTVAAVAAFQEDYNIKIGKKEKPGEKASRKMLEILYDPDTDEPTFKPARTPKPEPATKTDLR